MITTSFVLTVNPVTALRRYLYIILFLVQLNIVPGGGGGLWGRWGRALGDEKLYIPDANGARARAANHVTRWQSIWKVQIADTSTVG